MDRIQTFNLLKRYIDIYSDDTHLPFPIFWNNKNWCCATDKKQFIMIPENEENKISQPDIKTPNVAKIIPEFNLSVDIDINNLIKLYNDIPIEN